MVQFYTMSRLSDEHRPRAARSIPGEGGHSTLTGGHKRRDTGADKAKATSVGKGPDTIPQRQGHGQRHGSPPSIWSMTR